MYTYVSSHPPSKANIWPCVIWGFRHEVRGAARFWGITQHIVVIPYGRFRTTCRSHLQVSRNPCQQQLVQWDSQRLEQFRHHMLDCGIYWAPSDLESHFLDFLDFFTLEHTIRYVKTPKTADLILNSCFRVALYLYLATCFRVTSSPLCSGSISVCNPRLLGSRLLSSQFMGWPSSLIREAASYHWPTFNYRHSLQPCDAAFLNRDSINSWFHSTTGCFIISIPHIETSSGNCCNVSENVEDILNWNRAKIR